MGSGVEEKGDITIRKESTGTIAGIPSSRKRKAEDSDLYCPGNPESIKKVSRRKADKVDRLEEKESIVTEKDSNSLLEPNKSENSVKQPKSKTNPYCSSTKQVLRQVEEQGDVVQGVAVGAGQVKPQTMGVLNTRVGTRQRARLGLGEKNKTT